MRTFLPFRFRLRSPARCSWHRSLGRLANAHCQGKTTKAYMRAARLALRRSPRSRSEWIQPEAGATTVALRGADRLAANEEGVFSCRICAAAVYSNEDVSPTVPIPSRAQCGRSSFANERGQARSVRV